MSHGLPISVGRMLAGRLASLPASSRATALPGIDALAVDGRDVDPAPE